MQLKVKKSLYDIILSPDFDADLFVSETLRNPQLNDLTLVLDQLNSCQDRLKRSLRVEAIKLHATLSERENLWQNTEKEIISLRETVSNLRNSASKKIKEKITPFKKIQNQTNSCRIFHASFYFVGTGGLGEIKRQTV